MIETELWFRKGFMPAEFYQFSFIKMKVYYLLPLIYAIPMTSLPISSVAQKTVIHEPNSMGTAQEISARIQARQAELERL